MSLMCTYKSIRKCEYLDKKLDKGYKQVMHSTSDTNGTNHRKTLTCNQRSTTENKTKKVIFLIIKLAD